MSQVVVAFHLALHEDHATGYWRVSQDGWVLHVHPDGRVQTDRRAGKKMPVEMSSVVTAMQEFCARDTEDFDGSNARKNVTAALHRSFG